MKVSAKDLAKALEAIKFIATMNRNELPPGLQYEEILDSMINIGATLRTLSAEVENA